MKTFEEIKDIILADHATIDRIRHKVEEAKILGEAENLKKLFAEMVKITDTYAEPMHLIQNFHGTPDFSNLEEYKSKIHEVTPLITLWGRNTQAMVDLNALFSDVDPEGLFDYFPKDL